MLKKWNLFIIAVNSFFLQALWNFEKMQNIGMMFVLMNPLKKIYKDDDEKYYEAIKRHLEFFNIHPYVANIVVGIVLSLEEKSHNENIEMNKEISNIKSTMAGPLSAIGDSFFWGLWRPFVTLFVCFMFMSIFGFRNIGIAGVMFVIFVFLLVYNFPHIILRFYGLNFAYKMGTNVIVYIKKWHDYEMEMKIRIIGFALLVFTMIMFLIMANITFLIGLRFLLIFLIVDILKTKNISTIKIMFTIFIIFIVLGYLKVV